ncbi:hypothetical protein E0H90_09605 [Acinetobacter sp. ANC 3791]|nr:hypothetical protein E0H90_09605 [Acinetobacter sp. ANC 3791]
MDKKYFYAHQLCFFIHDVMVDFIKTGETHGIFHHEIKLSNDEENNLLQYKGNILDWLKNNNKMDEYEITIKKVIIQALLSDMLHCIYEALKAMEKGKISVAYMLIRKPIQESLYLFEEIILLKSEFIQIFENNPLKLRPKNAGGIEGHTKRIEKILLDLNMDQILDSSYVAKLRYDKKQEDSFDGVCNQAIHLFTEHQAIRTENLNINFIFADSKCKQTLYNFMYSRLPYLMYYMYIVFEKVANDINETTVEYLLDIHNRLAAFFLLAHGQLDDNYQNIQFYNLYLGFERLLQKNFQCELNLNRLEQIASTGKIS